MGSYRLELADAHEFIKTLPDASVDCVLTDPPYNTTQNAYEVAIDLPRMWLELSRVCKPTANLVFFSAQPFTTDLIASNRRQFRYDLIWRKSLPTGHLNATKQPLRGHETIVVFGSANATFNPQLVEKDYVLKVGKRVAAGAYGEYQEQAKRTIPEHLSYPNSVIDAKTAYHERAAGLHPSQKPVGLLSELVLTYTNPGDTVLDLFAGSGTTLAACLHTGRKAIGCEIDRPYHSVALRRLEAIETQQSLFSLT